MWIIHKSARFLSRLVYIKTSSGQFAGQRHWNENMTQFYPEFHFRPTNLCCSDRQSDRCETENFSGICFMKVSCVKILHWQVQDNKNVVHLKMNLDQHELLTDRMNLSFHWINHPRAKTRENKQLNDGTWIGFWRVDGSKPAKQEAKVFLAWCIKFCLDF